MKIYFENNEIVFEDFPLDFYSKRSLFKILAILGDDFYIVFDPNSSRLVFHSKDKISEKEAKDVVTEFFDTLISFDQAELTFVDQPDSSSADSDGVSIDVSD